MGYHEAVRRGVRNPRWKRKESRGRQCTRLSLAWLCEGTERKSSPWDAYMFIGSLSLPSLESKLHEGRRSLVLSTALSPGQKRASGTKEVLSKYLMAQLMHYVKKRETSMFM